MVDCLTGTPCKYQQKLMMAMRKGFRKLKKKLSQEFLSSGHTLVLSRTNPPLLDMASSALFRPLLMYVGRVYPNSVVIEGLDCQN